MIRNAIRLTPPSIKKKIPLWEVLFPLRNRPQEEYLLDVVSAANRELIVIHAFRGCRKTTCAFRIWKRSLLFHPATWRYCHLKLRYVADMRSLEAEMGMDTIQQQPSSAL